VILIAVVLLGAVAFALYSHFSDGTPQKKKNLDPTVCPDCGKKLPRAGVSCDYCGMKRMQEEIKAALKGPGAQRGLSTQSKVLLTFVAGILILVIGFWPQLRPLLFAPREGPLEYLTTRCSHCKRKLRYPVSSAGKKGVCPRCRWECDFPAEEESPAA
jgi:hypothetical protein